MKQFDLNNCDEATKLNTVSGGRSTTDPFAKYTAAIDVVYKAAKAVAKPEPKTGMTFSQFVHLVYGW